MSHEIRIPRLGWSMEEGVFVGWLKQPGQRVEVGDPLFELEGEKALQEIESVDAGVLQLVEGSPQAGSVVKVGSLLGHLVAEGESVALPAATVPPPAEQQSTLPPATGPAVRRLARELEVDLKNLTGTGKAGRITRDDVEAVRRTSPPSPKNITAHASPRAKRVAHELGIDWLQLSGTGQGGRIREADVRAASTGRAVGASLRVAITPRRRVIADRLRLSRERTIPVTLTTTIDATNLVALRTQFKSTSTVVPAYTDIVACLVATVLPQHRPLAARWEEDQQALRQPTADDLNIGIAVDTPNGLMVPVIRDVSRKSLPQVTQESKTLIEGARAGQLVAAQMQDGCFTITNLGAFGIDGFTPVINYPEVAILGLGAIRREPIALPDDTIAVRDRLTLSLTFDHAALDGAAAAAFLRDLSTTLENPAAYLLCR